MRKKENIPPGIPIPRAGHARNSFSICEFEHAVDVEMGCAWHPVKTVLVEFVRDPTKVGKAVVGGETSTVRLVVGEERSPRISCPQLDVTFVHQSFQ